MTESIDTELLLLLSRLKKLQEEFQTPEEARESSKAAVVDDGKADRFLEVKETVEERFMQLREAMDNQKTLETQGGNPRQLIETQAKVRTLTMSIDSSVKELENAWLHEAKKRKSRFTEDELQDRQMILTMFQQELRNLRDNQRAAYVRGYQSSALPSMQQSEAFATAEKPKQATMKGSTAVLSQRNNEMTEEHKLQLLKIKRKDAVIDEEIEKIGEGVDMLHSIAIAANEEIKLQNVMLTTLEEKMEEVHDKVLNINQKLKLSLEQTRTSDKIVVDILCILILIGMIVALVQTVQKN